MPSAPRWSVSSAAPFDEAMRSSRSRNWRGLADAAGATVVLRMLQERAKPDSGTFIGAGKVDEPRRGLRRG